MLRRLLTATTLALATTSVLATSAAADDPTYGGTAVKSMTANLVDTTGANIGIVQLHEDAAGVVQVRVDASGLPAGAHGIHVHAVGLCEGPAFASAGGHFNPTTQKHGLDNPEGPHGGDLSQIPATFTGAGTHTVTTDRLSLTAGPLSIADADGSALMIHATADDQVTDPTGNSGARIACAVLAAADPSQAVATPRPPAPLPPQTGSGALSTEDGNTMGWLAGLVAAAGTLFVSGAVIRRRVSKGS